MDGGSGSDTYACKADKSEIHIINGHIRNINKTFKLEVPLDNHLLPHTYWLPKLHKNPIKFRFIIAGPKCSLKPLSKAVTKIFQQFYLTIII